MVFPMMKRPVALLAFGAWVWAAAIVPALRQEPAPAPLKAFPDGPGRDVAVRLCSDCHPIVAVTRVRESRAKWGQIIERMIGEGAQIKDADFETLVVYFIVVLGKKVKINDATSVVVAETFDIDEKLAAAIVAYRQQKGPFKSWKDIAAVPGINPKRVEEQKDNLDFSLSRGTSSRRTP